jgi:hypothetical protein
MRGKLDVHPFYGFICINVLSLRKSDSVRMLASA